ncbi:MAG: site-specific integrase [Ruminococcaceae bacterium]|nr:site-specific integrase [Oscillospiraceae bacterium]
MAKAKKLPSGAWRVQYSIDGKRYSVTAESSKKAEYLAQKHQIEHKRDSSPVTKTFGKAVEDYIEMKSNILSPSTIRGYRPVLRHAVDLLKDIPLSRITTQLVQKQMNKNAAHYTPKSVRNHYALITAVLKNEGVSIGQVALKPKEKIEYHIPTKDEMAAIVEAVEGKGDIELYILFILMMGLRPSEAVALTWDNYDGETLLIKGSIVQDEHNAFVHKQANKTYHSTRRLDVPVVLREKLDNFKRTDELILKRTPHAYYSAFQKILKNNNLPHFRIYDLRHAYASVMLSLGVPDKYAMERMGHATPNMLKTVYQHTFRSDQEEISRQLDNFWSKNKE